MTEPADRPLTDVPLTQSPLTDLPRMPFAQSHPLQPAPQLCALQQRGPVHRVRTRMGDEAWLVTGYEQVRSLYSGEQLGRSHPKPDRAARLTASAFFGGRPREDFATEDVNRAWFKDLLHTIIAPRQLRRLRPWVDDLVTRLLDDLAASARPADFIDLIAVPLPTLVICELLGVPAADLPLCRDYSEAIASAGDEQRSAQGLTGLTGHLSELIASGRAAPDGLLSRLRATPYQLPLNVVAELGASLMFTGHHTTVVAIGYAALLLYTNPDQLKTVLDDPARLPDAIEECLRMGNVGVNPGGGNGIPTYARKNIDLGGACIHAGDLVLLDTGSANHDVQVFDDVYQFDVDRHSGSPHLTFGYGKHYCPGAPLARLEMLALFEQLIPRFPTMRLAVDLDELRSHDDQITGGLTALPVTW